MNPFNVSMDAYVDDMYRDALADVQTQLARVDTKASILFGFSLAALTAGTALAGKADLTGGATAFAVGSAGCILAALVLLGAAIRPNLNASHVGFMRCAGVSAPINLHWDFVTLARSAADSADGGIRAGYIWHLARMVQCKYLRVRRAVDLLGLGLASAVLSAILTGLGW